MSSTSTAPLCTAQETAPGLFNRCERSACSRNVGVLRRDVMPSSPLIAPAFNYPSNAERVVHHDSLAMTSSESKRSELFSILGEDSELRRLRTDDNTEKSSSSSSKVNFNISGDSIAISLDSHQKRFQGRAKSKKVPRKKNLPDIASTSGSEYFSGCPDTNSQASANASPCRETGVHYYHPYNKSSIYESSPKLVHKKCNLRSTAPVLYDLLSDDCEAENRDRSNTIPYTSTLATELCRSADLYLNPLPLPLISTSTLPLLTPHDQRPIAYFSNFIQHSLLMNSAPMNLLKMHPTDSASHWPAIHPASQSSWNTQLCKPAENLPAEKGEVSTSSNIRRDLSVERLEHNFAKVIWSITLMDSIFDNSSNDDSIAHTPNVRLREQQQQLHEHQQQHSDERNSPITPQSNNLVIVDDDLC